MMSASNCSRRSSSIALRPSSALLNTNETLSRKLSRRAPPRQAVLDQRGDVVVVLDDEHAEQAPRHGPAGSLRRMRSITLASASRPGPGSNWMPAPLPRPPRRCGASARCPRSRIGSEQPRERQHEAHARLDRQRPRRRHERAAARQVLGEVTDQIIGALVLHEQRDRLAVAVDALVVRAVGHPAARFYRKSGPRGHADGERRALVDGTRDDEIAAVILHDLAGERQSEAAAALFRRKERVEQLQEHLGWDTRRCPRPRNRDAGARRLAARADRDPRPGPAGGDYRPRCAPG